MTYRLGKHIHLAASLATLLIATSAHAQSTGGLREDASRQRSRIALDVGVYTHTGGFGIDRPTTFILPSLDANLDLFDVSPEVSFSVDLALRTVVYFAGSAARSTDDTLMYRAASGYVGMRVAIRPIEGLRVRAGAGLVAPFLNAYHEDPGPLLATFSLGTNAAWDPWLAWYGAVPIVLRADMEYRHELFFAGLEGAVTFGPAVLREYEGTAMGEQVAVWAGLRPIPVLAIGLRAHVVVTEFPRPLRTMAESHVFGALTPFIRGEFGQGFIESRFVINLVDNDWSRFAGEKSWGLYFLGGFNFAVAE